MACAIKSAGQNKPDTMDVTGMYLRETRKAAIDAD
jgi:hypothetical protein